MNKSECIYCSQNSDQVPLFAFQFKGEDYWICPQHLPILIHKPEQLAGKLVGIENIQSPDHPHH